MRVPAKYLICKGDTVHQENVWPDKGAAGIHHSLDRLAMASGPAAGDQFVWPSARGILDGFHNVLPGGSCVISLIERQTDIRAPEKPQQFLQPSNFSPELISLAQDLVIARDEARATSSEAAESQTRVEAIVESVVDAIITTDSRGSIHTFNCAAERIFGYSPDEIIGKTLGSLFLPHVLDADVDLFSGDVAAKIQSVLGRSLDEVGLTKAGIIFPVRFTATEMQLASQQMLNWVIRDVTDDQRTREALQHKSDLIQLLHSVTEAASEAETIAENIEIGLKSVCSHIGCHGAQGYLFSKPPGCERFRPLVSGPLERASASTAPQPEEVFDLIMPPAKQLRVPPPPLFRPHGLQTGQNYL